MPGFGGADAFFAVKAAVALDNRLLAIDFLLLQLKRLNARLEIRGALLHVFGIISRKLVHAAAQHFPHRIADMVEKIAVVADQQKRALVLGQGILQPFDGGEIEVVGGLVHQQHVGFLQKQLRKRNPRTLPAGQRFHFAAEHMPADPKAQKLAGNLALVGIAFQLCELLSHLTVFVRQADGCLFVAVFRHSRFHVAHAAFQSDDAAEHRKHRVPHGILGADIVDLRQIPQLQALVHMHGAAVGLLLAGEDPHQRGLAAAVGADKAHLLALLHGKGNVAQHLVDAEALLNIFNGD